MSSEQTRQLSSFDPVEMSREEDAVFQCDVPSTCQIERGCIEVCATLRLTARVDGMRWVYQL